MLNVKNKAMSEKTHWRVLHETDYFGAYSVPENQDLNVEIVKVEKKSIDTDKGKKSPTIATIKGQKPWILNATNKDMLTKVTGSPYVEDWAGVTVTVYTKTIRAFKKDVLAVRIRPTLPNAVKEKPELIPDTPKWETAVSSFASGALTIEKIKEHYSLSSENELKLKSHAAT